MKKDYNILICPLEWGLGHAARMIPIARRLKELNNNIIIGAGKDQLAFFRIELPDIKCIPFPGFKPLYSGFFPQYLILLFKIPLLIYHIISEHHRLKRIISDYKIDIVISDNRFGLWNRKVKTAYITHMPLIPFPSPFSFLEPLGIILHRAIIKRYTLCFIPDLPGEMNVTGRLSHGIKLPDNVRYIGILSRFITEKIPRKETLQKTNRTLVILSGPEPQRTILKEKLTVLLQDNEPETIMLEGNPEKKSQNKRKGNITYINHLSSREMMNMILTSRHIISRSGYTTIMELLSLYSGALLIPTPGQTEQEYLADYLSAKKWFAMAKQKKLYAAPVASFLNPEVTKEIIDQSRELFEKVLIELLEEPHIKSQNKEASKKSYPYLPWGMGV